MINDIEEFIKYFHGQRRRTQWVVDAVPPAKATWTPWPGEPSPIDILRYIAAGHLMYATAVSKDYWVVDAFETDDPNWDATVKYFQDTTDSALDLLRPLPNAVLQQKRRRPDGNIPTTAWRFLMAMIEHEITRRSQLNTYLLLLNARQPDLGGLTIENVRENLKQT